MDIPDELINKIAHDDAVLFVGAGLSQGAGLPGWRALLEPLADSIRLPDSQRIDLLKIAGYYERERGRQALLDHIFEQTDTIGKEPTENHHRLYRLGLRTWVTTNYDNLIERTFIELRGQFIKIVRDLNLSYTRTDRVTLVKLHGDREQPDTIVITEWDFNTYFRRDPRIRDKLISLLLEKTFLFVGYSHNDPDFRRILDEIAYDLREHQRRAYAMLFDADKFNISDLSSRNIHVLNIDMESQRNYSQRLGELLDELLRRAGKLPLARDTKSVEPSRSNLPHRLAFPPTARNDSTAVEAHTFIAGLHNEIVLAQYCIVGSYIRYDDRVRDTLKEVRRMITTGLTTHSARRENYLIWAPPGSGKSYFVDQIAKSLSSGVHYEVLDLTKINEEQFRARLDKAPTNPCLYLIDECDVEPQGWRPYELLLTPLNARVDRGTQVTFVMAGSSGTNAAEMMQRMSTRVKGGDLLDRIPIENRYEIAPFSLGDRLLVVLSQFWLAAQERGRIVREVEKFALYYVACNQHLENARQLQEFAARVIDRMPDGEDRAQYDYLFNAGNQRGLSSGGKQNGSTTASGENL